MTPAELRTLRQALFLSRDELARLAGVPVTQVEAWEAPDGPEIPAKLKGELRRLDAAVEIFARRIADDLGGRARRSAPLPVEAVLIRYADQEDLAKVEPETVATFRADLGLAASLHAGALERIRRSAPAASGGLLTLRLVWFEAQHYRNWLKQIGGEDDAEARSAWAIERLQQAEP